MQTFLPYADFAKSAAVLDRQRLGKQRVEVLQILRALSGESAGWRNHPATKMWRGYESALAFYGVFCVSEWVKRGYQNSLDFYRFGARVGAIAPPWFGDERFHSTHRAALLFKNPEWYGQFGWAEEPKLDYWWPN